MKFNCGPTEDERRTAKHAALQRERARQAKGERWFAWFPVRVGRDDCRWLETVIRKDTNVYEQYGYYYLYNHYHGHEWEYSAIE